MLKPTLALLILSLPIWAWAEGVPADQHISAGGHKAEMARRVKERMESQFKKADANGDALLSREEAEKGMPYVFRNFDAMDANKDGQLSIEEVSVHSEVAASHGQGK